MRPKRRLGPLGVRFAVAFVGVSLFAIAVFSAAVLVADRGNVSHLASTERDRTTSEAVALAQNAYQSGNGWSAADLRPLYIFAAQAGINVEMRDQNGSVLMISPPARPAGPGRPMTVQQTVDVGGHPVGTVAVAFPSGGVSPGDRHLRSALTATVAWSAALAILGALIVGVLTARGVVRPLKRLSAAVKSLKLGEHSPRVGPAAGPGELGELGRAFDDMADSLEHEDRLRRELVADVAHELRTPVAVMQAETEALSDGFTPPTNEALTSLHEEAVRLGRLVEDLQTLASAQAAGLELTPRPLDLGRVASDAAHSLASQFRNGRVELQQDLPPTGATGDPHRLHQVAINLLSNAAKFTPPGGRVTVRTFTEGSDAVLEVTDSGPGIPVEQQNAIWERFYRGNTASSGSGIGLAVVKALVDAHNATVSVESPAGGGARFVVRFPATVLAVDSAARR